MKRLAVVLSIAMAAALAVVACGKPAASPTTASRTTLTAAASTTTASRTTSTTSVSSTTTAGSTTTPTTTTTTGATTLKQYSAAPKMSIDPKKKYTTILHATKGDITLSLFASEDPVTVNNFVFLARDGFYNGVKFHRIIKGFMVQSGDPKGDGTGGPGYRFNDEPVTRKYVRGTIAMANSGANTNGSQFFIMHQDYALQPNYTIFGIATAGLDVLDAIANTPVKLSPMGEMSMPTQDVRINSIDIIEQ